jgi:hypothetical protein
MRGRARRCGEGSKRLGLRGGAGSVPAVKGSRVRRLGGDGGWADRGAAAKRGDDDAGSWAPRRRRGVRLGGPGPYGTGEGGEVGRGRQGAAARGGGAGPGGDAMRGRARRCGRVLRWTGGWRSGEAGLGREWWARRLLGRGTAAERENAPASLAGAEPAESASRLPRRLHAEAPEEPVRCALRLPPSRLDRRRRSRRAEEPPASVARAGIQCDGL